MANSVDPIGCHILRRLIWVNTVCKGLSVPIYRVITVQFLTLQLICITEGVYVFPRNRVVLATEENDKVKLVLKNNITVSL